MLDGRNVSLHFLAPRFIPRDETIHIGTVGTVSAEVLLVKKALASATDAYLVRTALRTYWPTHMAVPAAAENHYTRSRQTSCNQAESQQPSGLLFCVTHCKKPSSTLRICPHPALRNGPEVTSIERPYERKLTNPKGTQPRCLTEPLRTPAKRCNLTTYWKFIDVGPLPVANGGTAVPSWECGDREKPISWL